MIYESNQSVKLLKDCATFQIYVKDCAKGEFNGFKLDFQVSVAILIHWKGEKKVHFSVQRKKQIFFHWFVWRRCKQRVHLTIFEIPQVWTDGYEQAKCFLCSHMPYPKTTNRLEIWSLHIQAIVCVCMWMFKSVYLTCFQSALMHRYYRAHSCRCGEVLGVIFIFGRTLFRNKTSL